jgi:hypothetical protein
MVPGLVEGAPTVRDSVLSIAFDSCLDRGERVLGGRAIVLGDELFSMFAEAYAVDLAATSPVRENLLS